MASLVAPSLALTAGHCKVAKGDEIVFGVLNWDRHTNSGEGISRTVAQTSNQGDATFSADASSELLVLSAPIWNIQPVRLASPADHALWAKKAILQDVGFGDITPDCPRDPEILSAELRSADMKIVDTTVSNGIYRGLAKAESVKGYPQKGDSGSPLLAKDAAGRFVQVGIYQADVGACGHNYGFYYDRIWPQKKLLGYVASRQASNVKIASAIPGFPITQGETFFNATLTINYSSGYVVLAGSPDVTADLNVDDILSVHVRRADGTDHFLNHDFSNGCDGSGLTPVSSLDITGLLGLGANQVFISLSDECGGNAGNTDVYAVADGSALTLTRIRE